MRKISLLLALLSLLYFNNLAIAQSLDPVSWEMEVVETGDGEYDLIFLGTIEDGWSIYSQHLADDGPIPTGFFFDEIEGVDLKGALEECGVKKEGYDKFFEMDLIKYSKYAIFVKQIKTDADSIKGFLEYMCCDANRCLPPVTRDIALDLKKGWKAEEIKYDTKKLCENKFEFSKRTGSIQPSNAPQVKFASQIEGIDEDEEGILDPVKWSYRAVKADNGKTYLEFTADIDKGWQIYSQFLETDDGPIRTSFTFYENPGFELVGKTTENATKLVTEYDEFFDMELTKLKGKAVFKQEIKIQNPEIDSIGGWFEFMVCDKKQCLPPTSIDFVINPKDKDGGTAKTSSSGNNFDTKGEGTPVYQEFDYVLSEDTCHDHGGEEEDKTSLWWIFFAGFFGGLIALVTPCVFPMIPLTVSFFTKSSTSRSSGLKNAFLYGLSIIIIYVLLGLLITGIFGADALNLLSTNAIFNIFFFILFIVFALSFFGLFEITLPSSWANKTDRAADKGGLIGIFFMAFTLALVSFSCTGPIIGTLLVEAATGTGGPIILGRVPVGPLVGMFGFSLALALPFAVFAAFPGWLNSLPKSGGWMNAVKVTLGFVEVALALKFLSVADLTMGWKILPYELFVGAWVLCALGLGLYYFKIIQFPHDSKGGKLSFFRSGLGIASFALAVYLAMGFSYSEKSETFATPGLLSGLAPPAGHSYIHPKKCPLNLECYKDFDEGLAAAKKQNKPILLDFTGHGCVNCRRMEDQVWGEKGVYELIKEKYVLVSLYVDERKALDEPYTSAFSGRKMKTVGNKWADFQAIHFNRNSQPYYVLLSDEGKVLNEPVAYTPDVDEYQAFLQCGVDRYNDMCGGCLSAN